MLFRSRVLGLWSWILGLGSWVLGLGSWVLDLGSWVLGLGSWILDLGSWVLVLHFGLRVFAFVFACVYGLVLLTDCLMSCGAAFWSTIGYWVFCLGSWIEDPTPNKK